MGVPFASVDGRGIAVCAAFAVSCQSNGNAEKAGAADAQPGFPRYGELGFMVPPEEACRAIFNTGAARCFHVAQAEIDRAELALLKSKGAEVKGWWRQYLGVKNAGRRKLEILFFCPKSRDAPVLATEVARQLAEDGDCYREASFWPDEGSLKLGPIWP